MTAVAVLRYGRRAGGWLPTTPPAPVPGQGDRPTCALCGRRVPDTDPPPAICGRPACRARHNWGPQDWAGRARMARARHAAGAPLDALDIDALNRPPTFGAEETSS